MYVVDYTILILAFPPVHTLDQVLKVSVFQISLLLTYSPFYDPNIRLKSTETNSQADEANKVTLRY